MSGITWLGHGSFQIDTPAGARVLIDPWITGNPSWPEGRAVDRCDAILLTHGHGDHAADAAAIAKEHSAPVATIPELAGWLEGQGVTGHRRLQQGRCDRHRRAAGDDDERRALLERPRRDAARRSRRVRDRGARHADDLRRRRHRGARRHGPDRRALHALDRDPADRRPLHDGPAPGRLRGAADRSARDRARPLRHVRAADRHARGAARRAGADRRQRDGARGAARARSCEPSRDVLDRRLRRPRAAAGRRRRIEVPGRRRRRAVARGRGRRDRHAGALEHPLRAGRPRPPARRATTAREALDALLAADPGRDDRQAGIVDARGRGATHTGQSCMAWAGGRTGLGYAAQGNILTGPGVVDAMAESFESSERRARRTGCCWRSRPAMPQAATGAAGSRPRSPSSSPRAATAATTTAWSTCASTTTRIRWPSCAGCTTSTCC